MKTKQSIVHGSLLSILGLWLAAVCLGITSSLLCVQGRVSADEAQRPQWVVPPAAGPTDEWDIQQEPVVEVEVDVRNEDDVALLHSMGYSCGVGMCELELRQGEELALLELGLPVRAMARAIKLSGRSTRGSEPAAAALEEHSVYGADWRDHDIWDAELAGGCGEPTLASIEVSGAPADATITRVSYSVRIVHSHVGDVFAELGHWHGAESSYMTIWNRWGHGDDEGMDDDPEFDLDIELRSRETTFFNGRLVNSSWQLAVRDCAWWNTGHIDYWYIYVYYWTCDPPATPSAPVPGNAYNHVSRDADLDWADAAEAISYDVRFGASSPPPQYAHTTSSSLALPTLACGTTYYWQIVANSACGSSTEGPLWYFITFPAPTAPTIPSPTDGATDQPGTLNLHWVWVADATSYDVYLGTDDRRPPPLLGNTTSNSYALAGLNCNTRYYWRVAAKNACGSTSSPVWDFTTGSFAPAAPTWVSPPDGASDVPLGADLDWADASGATSYDVYLGTGLRRPLPLLGNTTSSNYALGDLTCGTHYYWKVVAKSACGDISGPEWDFGTECCTPSAPSGASPVNAATGVPLGADLDWADASGATSYDVYLGTGLRRPLPLLGNTASSSYALANLNCNTHYYWTIVAKSACGDTSGPEWDFTTECCRPGTPSGPSPADRAIGQPANTELDWADVAGATSYDVYLGVSSDPPLLGNATRSNYALLPLTCGTHYYWKIVAKNSCGDTVGPTWEFTILPCSRIYLPLLLW